MRERELKKQIDKIVAGAAIAIVVFLLGWATYHLIKDLIWSIHNLNNTD